jgi:hypothetical protein
LARFGLEFPSDVPVSASMMRCRSRIGPMLLVYHPHQGRPQPLRLLL